jgi:hypothetical protein
MKPTTCTCEMRACSMRTTTMSMTLPTTTTTSASSSTATPSTQPTSSLVSSSNVNSRLADQTLTVQDADSSTITMPAAQSPNDNTALIGGIVGGAVALLLIGALTAFCVVRRRRNHKEPSNAGSASHYGHIGKVVDRSASNNYSNLVVAQPEHDTYGNGQLEVQR